ncbi:T9SS type A sorting domain-containing protein [Flavobacterium sp. UBA6135]|uniref:T9SS type A sorting domain-containing protein n=1 Tax=Flavobacterium sp. UBA6135 TaxID=1946553 RepID=UPI0025B89053|nr:T9SS type A sorting domain-containing protein [Flavobacterium sp. UBA6135]
MKKLYFLTLLSIGSLGYSQVTLPHYDGMDYPSGTALQNQTGWTALNTGDDLEIVTGSLNYSGLQASTGNKLAFGGAGIDAGKDFTSQTANTVYFSILLNVTDLTATTSTTGGYIAGFVQGTGTTFGGTLWLNKVSESTYNIGVNPRTTAANTVYSSATYNTNTTYLVVISYTFVDGTGNDVVKIWINPSSLGSTEPTANATATNTGTDLTSVSRLLVRQGSATDTPNVELDEFRIGTTWAEVTPEATANVNDNAIAGLKIYPNPIAGNTLYVSSDLFGEKTVAVYDVLGKRILSSKVANDAVNIGTLNKGVYIVKVTQEGKTATRKLVVQ